MSDLPDRDEVHRWDIAGARDVIAAYERGELKSRDEMDWRTAAASFYGMKVEHLDIDEDEAYGWKLALDAAWGIDGDG